LQQTASAIEEVSSMVNKNALNASSSSKISNECRSFTESGNQGIRNLVKGIEEISEAVTVIIKQVEEDNEKLNSILGVITEIQEKTRVINEIVFQTKLLSFNASVEAARAGEHGGGFAIVAEEIGSLAQASGEASVQIKGIVEQSISKVNSIVSTTQEKVTQLSDIGKSKIQQLNRITTQFEELFQKIFQGVNEVDKSVQEISRASMEQSQGVQEIAQAIAELDQITQHNSHNATESSLSAKNLSNRAVELHQSAEKLIKMVLGNQTDAAHVLQSESTNASGPDTTENNASVHEEA
jgi:methyl-accepting chemotaxis protein